MQQLVAAVPALELKLIRLPWKRCLASLATGDVDAVVGSYSTERAEFAVFPYRDGQPDPTRAFNLHHTCLVSRQDAPWQWTNEGLTGIDQLVVAAAGNGGPNAPPAYPAAWAAEQFGAAHAAEIGELLARTDASLVPAQVMQLPSTCCGGCGG